MKYEEIREFDKNVQWEIGQRIPLLKTLSLGFVCLKQATVHTTPIAVMGGGYYQIPSKLSVHNVIVGRTVRFRF